MKMVIALGGNALGSSVAEQKRNATLTAKKIVEIIKQGHDVIISHGNGPQVGLINLAFSEGKKVNPKVEDMPFSECGAMSQGYIGYHLQNAISNELALNNINKKVVTLITQVEVAKDDPAFLDPTKPIGSFYSKEEALKLGYPVKEDAGRGYRRVIASPKPVKIIESEQIASLVNAGFIVIACGGGGIPVISSDGKLSGIDAVIDKDFASSKLADQIDANCLLILTAVDNVLINFGMPNEQKLLKTTVDEMEKYNLEGHFKAGSMKPKVEASIDFAKGGKRRIAIITSIEKASEALQGLSGTTIRL